MNDLIFLAPLGVVLGASLIYLGRLEESKALRLWLFGFGALFAGAVFIIPNTTVGWAITSVFSSAFVALMYAGSMRFAERPIPVWLLPSALVLGGLRAGFTLVEQPGAMSAVAGVYAVVLLAIAGRTLRNYSLACESGRAERLLGPAMTALGVLLGVSIGVRFLDIHGGPMFAVWISAAGGVGVLQSLAGLERTRRRDTQRQHELETERRTLRAVIETAPVDIVLRDDRGQIRMVNRSAADRFGIALGEEGDPIADQDLPPDLIGLPTDRKATVRVPAANGSTSVDEQYIEVVSSPVVTESGESLGRLWISRDITQERQLQQQLVQSQKMETLGTLAGGVAHDFNNHLTTILGNAHLAGEKLRGDQTFAQECLIDLERAAEHCAELTQGLLAFARRTPSSSEALNVEPILGEVEALLGATLPSRIELEVERAGTKGWPLADATQLKQVIINLAINGRDAIQGAGTIRLSARDVVLPRARVTASGEARPGRYVEFAVEDTGHGIEPACRERVFDPFFTTKPTGEGTGLGLAIAYGVASAHDGYIDLDSAPGRTVLRVGIPAVEPAPAHAGRGVEAAPRGAGETVLLADDEPSLRRLVRGQLEALGYRVLEANCGERAIEIAAEPDCKIDLAVVDLSMPGIDGLETLEALRVDRPGLPGLIVSGYIDANAEKRIDPDVGVLLKPFDHEGLARAVRSTLAG